MVCPVCGRINSGTAKFCAQCGKPLSAMQFCPDCGADCPAIATQCSKGHTLPLPSQRLLGEGVVLANRYRIEKLLGCGGFGAVYLATDINFEQIGQKRQVAVKENHDPSVLNTFLKEAGLLADLHHPNLPRVSDFFQERPTTIPLPRAYMVMDYIAGEELWERVQRLGKLSEAEVLELLQGVFDALEYLHKLSLPIYHRDIKPQNIRLMKEAWSTGQGTRAVLVDFGVAKVGGGATTIGSRAATAPFAPPEQYRMAGETDERSDQYALAMTIYCALTGKVPVHAEATVRERALTTGKPDPLEPIENLAPDVSPRVRQAVMKALSVDKEKRFANIRAFREALYPSLVLGMTRRQLVGAFTGGIALAALLGFGSYQIWRWQQPLWLVAQLKGHSAGVTWVAFTPDGQKLISASHDKTVRVWDWQKGKNERALKGHTDSVRCFTFLSHQLIASAGWDGKVMIWDWTKGNQVLHAGMGRLNTVAASNDSRWLVAGGERGLCLLRFDGSRVKTRCYRLPFSVHALAFHPNNRTLAVGDQRGKLWFWDVVNGFEGGFSAPSWQAHQDAVTALAFHPNGSVLLSGGEDADLAVWDVASRSLRKRLKGWHQREIRAVAFRGDGKIAVSCSMDDRLRVWRTSDWQLILTREGGRNWALALTFSPSGNFLASASKDETVKVWRMKF